MRSSSSPTFPTCLPLKPLCVAKEQCVLLFYFLVTFHLRHLHGTNNNLSKRWPFKGPWDVQTAFHRASTRPLSLEELIQIWNWACFFCRRWRIFNAACWIFIRLKRFSPPQTCSPPVCRSLWIPQQFCVFLRLILEKATIWKE